MTNLTSPDQRGVSNVLFGSSLISLVNKDEMKHINSKTKSDCAHFNDLEMSIVSKSIDN